MFFAITVEVVVSAGDGQNARQLHHPPNDDLHRKHRVAHPRSGSGHDKYRQCRVAKVEVIAHHQQSVFLDDMALP